MGQEDGEIRRDIPAEELSNHLEWLSASIMIVWLAFPERTLTDILDREIDLFLSGQLSARSRLIRGRLFNEGFPATVS